MVVLLPGKYWRSLCASTSALLHQKYYPTPKSFLSCWPAILQARLDHLDRAAARNRAILWLLYETGSGTALMLR